MRQVIFLPESTCSPDALTLSVQPPVCNCMHIYAHVKKSEALAAVALFGHTEILHTLIGMGSAALAAAVP